MTAAYLYLPPSPLALSTLLSEQKLVGVKKKKNPPPPSSDAPPPHSVHLPAPARFFVFICFVLLLNIKRLFYYSPLHKAT